MKKIFVLLAVLMIALSISACATTGGIPGNSWDQLTTLAKGMKVSETFTWSFIPGEVKATIAWESWSADATPPVMNACGSFTIPIEQAKKLTGSDVLGFLIQNMNLCLGNKAMCGECLQIK